MYLRYMRWAYIFMASLMFSLALMPCTDAISCALEPHHAHHQSHDQPCQDESDGQHQEEHCSPLCICNCCHTSVFISNWEFEFAFHSKSQVFNSYYRGDLSLPFQLEILRPPEA